MLEDFPQCTQPELAPLLSCSPPGPALLYRFLALTAHGGGAHLCGDATTQPSWPRGPAGHLFTFLPLPWLHPSHPCSAAASSGSVGGGGSPLIIYVLLLSWAGLTNAGLQRAARMAALRGRPDDVVSAHHQVLAFLASVIALATFCMPMNWLPCRVGGPCIRLFETRTMGLSMGSRTMSRRTWRRRV